MGRIKTNRRKDEERRAPGACSLLPQFVRLVPPSHPSHFSFDCSTPSSVPPERSGNARGLSWTTRIGREGGRGRRETEDWPAVWMALATLD